MVEQATSNDTILYYVHDPMCSWCWAFRPAWQAIIERLPADILPRRVLGGLAPDTKAAMPEAQRQRIRSTWEQIQRTVPGTQFNFTFWHVCRPRRSTYPACRAVIAAMRQGAHEEAMILSIQQAYYLEARNPSDESTLIELASGLGLDENRFAADLNAAETHNALRRQIDRGGRLGADGFPSLILAKAGAPRRLRLDYNAPERIVRQIVG